MYRTIGLLQIDGSLSRACRGASIFSSGQDYPLLPLFGSPFLEVWNRVSTKNCIPSGWGASRRCLSGTCITVPRGR